MSDLKTLKDLEYEESFGTTDSSMFTALLCPSDSLREEAVKWIKALEDIDNWIEEHNSYCNMYRFKLLEDLQKIHFDRNDVYGAVIILKHIFNITEDDLK